MNQLDNLYFDPAIDENEPIDRRTSDWHEMLTAPLFTNAVLECLEMEMNSGHKHCLDADH
jgi:hypothetical protein